VLDKLIGEKRDGREREREKKKTKRKRMI